MISEKSKFLQILSEKVINEKEQVKSLLHVFSGVVRDVYPY